MITDVETIARRFALWATVCCVSAAPSFVWAQAEFSRPAMVFGVALFVVIYTVAGCTDAFERLHRRPYVRRTLYIGYGTRATLSILFPIGMGIDVIPGLFSMGLVRGVGLTPQTFAGTLATTLVQGTLLNAIVFVFMTIVYGCLRAFTKPPPPDDQRRGFAVLPVLPATAPGNDAAPAR